VFCSFQGWTRTNTGCVMRKRYCRAGPSSGFSSRGAKNQKGGHIYKMQYWMYAATGEPNLKWGVTDFKWGAEHHWRPPLVTAQLYGYPFSVLLRMAK